MIKRIQRKRTKRFKLPPNTVCVNRGTKWGNPFRVEDYGRDEAIAKFREYARDWDVTELTQVDNIACFCKVGEPCHGDVLIEMVNKLGR